jgi:hypothetical protein
VYTHDSLKHSPVSLLLFGEYRNSLPEVKQRDVRLIVHLHPEPRLRMRGAIPLLLLYTCVQKKTELFK